MSPSVVASRSRTLLATAVGATVLLTVAAAILDTSWTWAGFFALAVEAVVLLADHRQRCRAENLATRMENRAAALPHLLWLDRRLNLSGPLPSLGNYAIAADNASHLVRHVERAQPRLILEAGSGASSLFQGRLLQLRGEGHLVSLEHDKYFAQLSRRTVENYGLESVVEVRHAPLSEFEIEGHTYLWYDAAAWQDLDGIEFLLIDGPPRRLQPLSRFPAVPLLASRLAPACSIAVDDAARPDERETVRRWLKILEGWTAIRADTSTGWTVLEPPR